eukprot:SAG11_NODE_891_length_6685_cov_4.256909_2_plen_205_part_00
MLLVVLNNLRPLARYSVVWRHEAEAEARKGMAKFRDRVMAQKAERLRAKRRELKQAREALEAATAKAEAEAAFDALELLATAVVLGEKAVQRHSDKTLLPLLTLAERRRLRLEAEQRLAGSVLSNKTHRPMGSAALEQLQGLIASAIEDGAAPRGKLVKGAEQQAETGRREILLQELRDRVSAAPSNIAATLYSSRFAFRGEFC